MTQYTLLFQRSRDLGEDTGTHHCRHQDRHVSSSSLDFQIQFESFEDQQREEDTVMMDAQESDHHSDDSGFSAMTAAKAGSIAPNSASGTGVPNHGPRQQQQQQQPQPQQQHVQYSLSCTTQSPPLQPQDQDTSMTDCTGTRLDGYYTPTPAETIAPTATLPESSQRLLELEDQANLIQSHCGTCTESHAHRQHEQQNLANTGGQSLGQLQVPNQGHEQEPTEECRKFQIERKYSPSTSPSPSYLQRPVSVSQWPSTPNDFEEYHGYSLHGSATISHADAIADGGPNTVTLPQNNNDACRSPRSWSLNSQEQQQHQLQQQETHSWLSHHQTHQPQQQQYHHSQQSRYPSGICTPVEELQPSPISAVASPYSAAMSSLNRSFDTSESHSSYPIIPSTTVASHAPYQLCHQMPVTDGIPPAMAPSPCSLSIALPGRMSREASVSLSDVDIGWPEDLHCTTGNGGSPQLMEGRYSTDLLGQGAEAAAGKTDEPYAQLIYKAFMSRPNKAMTLQDIYQWFRDNTEKAKSEGKGWQNSIRHNLSMNGAFTKRCIKTVGTGSDACVSLEPAQGADGRKSTEWFLEPEFYAKGVESTTRYRTPKASRRMGSSSHHSTNNHKYSSHGHGHGHNQGPPSSSIMGGHNTSSSSHSRQVAGRKGGQNASQNKKLRKQQQAQLQQRMQQQQQQQQGYHTDVTSVPSGYRAHHEAGVPDYYSASPYPNGYGVQNTSSNSIPGGGSSSSAAGAAARRDYNSGLGLFGSHDLPISAAKFKRSSTLKSAEENDLPLTPGPVDALPAPEDHLFHKQQHHSDGYGNYQQQQQQQVISPTSGYGGGAHEAQYTLGDVGGVYNSTGSSVHVPMFVDAADCLSGPGDGVPFTGYSTYQPYEC